MPKVESTLICGGAVVGVRGVSRQNILIRGETIAQVGTGSMGPVDEVIDAEGLLILPGAVDPHVHFNDAFMGTVSVHDFFTGTRAAGNIALVSSDDAAYSWQAKLMGKDRFDLCPNGIPGIEVRLPLLYTLGVSQGRVSLTRMVELISTEPARLFGLFPKKGIILPGSDADLVLFDPHERWIMGRETLHMAADWSAYQGIEVTGRILLVFSRGELIIDHGTCLAEAGRGRYLHRKIEA